MGLLRRLLTSLGGGGGLSLEIWEYPELFSFVYLCALENIGEVAHVASISSIVALSLLEIRLYATLPGVTPLLCSIENEVLTPQPSSVVLLSQAV